MSIMSKVRLTITVKLLLRVHITCTENPQENPRYPIKMTGGIFDPVRLAPAHPAVDGPAIMSYLLTPHF